MTDFDAAGVRVYALSYDEADALADFRKAHDITYTLLSDPDSEVIREFGILNTLIDADDHPWFGIPYPGTYVLDTNGTITHKFFDSNLAVRAGPEQLLRAVRGEAAATSSTLLASAESTEPDEVTMNVFLDGASLTPTVQRDLVVRFSVPDGRHVYAEPAPEGSVALAVTLAANERIVQRPLIRPASEYHSLAGTRETFPVHHGEFEARLPLTVNGGILADDDSASLTISGTVRWQACDDEVCDIPVARSFELTVPVTKSPPVALWGDEGMALEPNARAHFQRMTSRRESEA
jgi:DsbC/DsbD-like thiol-disulfide interchange protein